MIPGFIPYEVNQTQNDVFHNLKDTSIKCIDSSFNSNKVREDFFNSMFKISFFLLNLNVLS